MHISDLLLLANCYVGKKLSVTLKENTWKSSSGVTHKTHFLKINTDDDLYKELESAFPSFRLKVTGHWYTQDIKPDRINFKVSDNGTITEVYLG